MSNSIHSIFRIDRSAGRVVHWRAGEGCAGGAGFTLIEIILVLSLLVLITALTMGAFFYSDSGNFDEGIDRFESMLRMARADSASCGKRIQLAFESRADADGNKTIVLWEPSPLDKPGEFVDYATACKWRDMLPDGLLVIGRVSLTGPSAYRTLVTEGMGESAFGETPDSITFYADGSSESAVIELIPTSPDDVRRAIIILDGLASTIETYQTTVDNVDGYFDLAVAGDSVAAFHAELSLEEN